MSKSPPIPKVHDNDMTDLVERSQVVILGEMHGNHTGPEALATVMRAALAVGHPVSVGLEAPEGRASFREYLDSDGGTDARATLLADRFWNPGSFDGRASVALLDLFDEVRQARKDGADVDLFGFVRIGEHDAGDQNPHEQRMADAIVERAGSDPGRKIVALAGNLHARNNEFQFGRGPKVSPMAARVREQIPKTTTVKLQYGGGSTLACGERGLTEMELSEVTRPPRILTQQHDGDYDMTWWVGPAAPSPSPNAAK